MRFPRWRSGIFVAWVPALLLAAACDRFPTHGRVIVLGLDGMDPATVDLLMAEGKLPNFARLRRDGAYGLLESRKPLLSPVIWTTIATGKTPDQHRIGHFVAINPTTGEQLPVTSRMRRVKALWNIASDGDRSVAAVGWWATWPAEAVNGAMVSDHLAYHFLFQQGLTGDTSSVGKTFPPGLEAELRPLLERPDDVTAEQVAQFVQVSREEFDRPFRFNDPLGHLRWALATAESHKNIGLRLWQEQHPDLLLVYVEGTDSISHLFGHLFRAQGLSGELSEQQQRYGMAVESMYVYADGLVGEFLEAMDRNTTLVVLSDHGFELGALQDDPSKTRDMRRVSEQYHRLHGILYLYGRAVQSSTRIDGATILDVAPTVLALLGLPAALDMPGRILEGPLTLEPPPRRGTYETDGESAADPTTGSREDQAILERLKSLGYVGSSSPAGDRNLAAGLFESGRFAEAVAAYEQILAGDPRDDAAHASLAGALGALGRYDEALEHLAIAGELSPLDPEIHHNRGVIYELRGDREAAIRQYLDALRYAPDYEPSRRALATLGVTTSPLAPRTDAERQAAQLAERASRSARRGDYDEALRLLADAEDIAPRYALIHQYRSNVAYLKGDRPGAIAALERCLQLEPDNALYRENLRRLRNPPPG